jgi:hypothetical protein
MGTFDYVVQGDLNSDTGTVAVTASANASPVITITQPPLAGVTVTVGDTYAITYDLTDGENDTTDVTFYYSTDTTFDGVGTDPIACTASAVIPPQTGLTCNWDTTGVTAGGQTYYLYGVADDGISTPGTNWSSGTVQVNDAPANITVLSGFQSPATPLASGTTGATKTSFSAAAGGSNRLLVVVAEFFDNGTTALTCTPSITWGAQGDTEATSILNVRGTYIGFFRESEFQDGSNLVFACTGGNTAEFSYLYAATLAGVNQTTPNQSQSSAYLNNLQTVTLSNYTYSSGGYSVAAIASNNDLTANGAINETPTGDGWPTLSTGQASTGRWVTNLGISRTSNTTTTNITFTNTTNTRAAISIVNFQK